MPPTYEAKSAGHERPLLIGIDQENGLVTRISPPIAAQVPVKPVKDDTASDIAPEAVLHSENYVRRGRCLQRGSHLL
jgi:hypothetical protein